MGSNDCDQDLRISLHPSPSERNQALLGLVARGRSTLGFALGNGKRRVRLLSRSVNWSRVVVAWRRGEPVGHALLRFAGHGPYRPGWRVFFNEYGWLHGAYAALVFHVVELWSWQSPFYVYSLRVLPQERGHGTGEALVKAVLEHARSCGYDSVELHVGANFEVARRLYERCGFRRSDVRIGRL